MAVSGFKKSAVTLPGFSIPIGTTGITNYVFSAPNDAGFFSISSSLGDSSYDIYFINANGDVVGYTNGVTIEASGPFNRAIVYGGEPNDLLSFSTTPVAIATTPTDVIPTVPPVIDSLSTTSIPNINDAVTVTGQNFATDIEAYFVGTDNVSVAAKSIVRNSQTEVVVTRPDSLSTAYEPYDIILVNPLASAPSTAGNARQNALFIGTAPSWNTAPVLAAATYGIAYNNSLSASDADGQAVTYSKVSGDSRVTVGANGAVSATISSSETVTFTARATDSAGLYSDRTFSFSVVPAAGGTVSVSGNYVFHTFTSSSTFTAYTTISPIDYLIVAGGGGAGAVGPGGGGGYRQSVTGYASGGGAQAQASTSVTAGSYPVVVGAAGTYSTTSGYGGIFGGSGGASSFNGISTVGGGGGGYSNFGGWSGRPGGSGGGAAASWTDSGSGGAGTTGEGYRGGNATATYGADRVGGGGGAGAAGGDAPAAFYGGDGVQWVDGVYRAGGGPGIVGGVYGAIGQGHGPNTGGGGWWQSGSINLANDGVVILRYSI